MAGTEFAHKADKSPRRFAARIVVALLGLLIVSAAAEAQTYPTRPITVVTPTPVGGPMDALMRIIAEHARVTLGQPFVIEATSGAGGTIGTLRVVRAPADGYTLLIGNHTTQIAGPTNYPVQYDVLTDLEPIGLIASAPTMMVGRRDFPADSLQALATWMKANPEMTTVGSVGAPSSSLHVQKLMGVRVKLVPYRGGGAMNQDLVAGHLDLRLVAEASLLLPYIRDRTIKAFSIHAATRWNEAPQIPTSKESGVDFQMAIWNGLWAPRGTPPAVIERLSLALRAALDDPTVRQRIVGMGMELASSEQRTPEGLRAFLKAETEKWWPIIKAAQGSAH